MSLTREEIEEQYKERYSKLQDCSQALISDLKHFLEGTERIDQITGRAKGIKSFVDKSIKEIKDENTQSFKRKYENPFLEIQDQIGLRIVTYYKQDVELLSQKIENYYSIAEETKKEPSNNYEFRYFGKHFILNIPQNIREEYGKQFIPTVFELQIKTLFQHAWGQCDHDINYKGDLDSESKRLIALASAQSWGADQAFDAILKIIRNKESNNE